MSASVSRADNGLPCESEPAGFPIRQRLRGVLAAARRLLPANATTASCYPTVLPLAATGVPVFASRNGGDTVHLDSRHERVSPIMVGEVAARQPTRISPPAARLARITDATIAAGVVQLPDSTIVEESLVNTLLDTFGPFTRDGAGRIRQTKSGVVRRLRGGPHVLLKQQCDANYSRWLMEGLPRLAVVDDHVRLSGCKFIISAHHGAMQQIYEDSLALFGIRRDQIVEIGDETVQVDDLLYPTPMTTHPRHVAPRCIEVLEQVASRVRANPCGFDRIYVSRNRAATRRLLNETEIISILESHGFVVVEPETLSLYQQISLFRSAGIVVGICGAGLTNVAFAGGDVTLFTLGTPMLQDDFFPALMSLKQGRFLSQNGTATEPERGLASDFTLNVALFESILATIL